MIEPGTTLGHYEVVGTLGAGGMGEVYRARDARLGREVAIKLLLDEVSADQERLARFEREARTLASLNHANIAVIHGFESEAASPFLVMELVEGEDLAERIARGPLPVAEAIPLFVQIAEGLEAAHEQGVVHRDLKPANVKVTGKGMVKILDFGLAKAMQPPRAESSAASQSISPTLTLGATQQGMILGTAAYMAPEQAQGLEADRRADIWAFGACLFEAIAGKRAFEAENAPLTLARVLDREPEWQTLPEGLPWRVREVLRRCLMKDPAKRLHDIADARLELLDALDDPAPYREVVAETPEGAHGRAAGASRTWLAGATAAAALAGIAAWNLKPAELAPDSERAVMRVRLSSELDAEARTFEGSTTLAISPDGGAVVYSSASGLVLRSVDQLEGRLLAGAENGEGPFFSPDGEWVGFFVSANRELRKVSVRGGPSVRICESGSYTPGAAWSEDDTIYFTTAGTADVFRVPSSGGEAEPLGLSVPASTVDLRWPAVLPGGKALLVSMLSRLSAADAQIGVADMETGEVRPLPLVGTDPIYLQSGHLMYGFEGSLFAVAFDAEGRELQGDPLPVVTGVATDRDSGAANFALSEVGSLVYLGGGGVVSNRALIWVDRDGGEEPTPLPSSGWTNPRISRTGDRIALGEFTDSTDLWLWDRSRPAPSRITFDPGLDDNPVWSADGREIFFSSTRDGPRGIYRLDVEVAGTPVVVAGTPEHARPQSTSPDGKLLVYKVGPYDDGDLAVVNLTGDPAPRILLDSRFHETGARISPDGRFLLYQSDESGVDEVYVRPFPDVDSARWQISIGGGAQPLWSPAGDEIFYRRAQPEVQVMAVSVETDSRFRAATPTLLFSFPAFSQGVHSHYWDVDRDGERFLVMRAEGEQDPEVASPEIVLVLNWLEELRRLVPQDR